MGLLVQHDLNWKGPGARSKGVVFVVCFLKLVAGQHLVINIINIVPPTPVMLFVSFSNLRGDVGLKIT